MTSTERLKKLHGTLTILWFLLIIPGVMFWRNSVPFLVAISIYANVAGHFSAWQGARSECATERSDGN